MTIFIFKKSEKCCFFHLAAPGPFGGVADFVAPRLTPMFATPQPMTSSFAAPQPMTSSTTRQPNTPTTGRVIPIKVETKVNGC